MGKASLVFYKFDGLWVVPAQGKTPDGLTVHIEPVALIPEEDVVELSRAIVERLHLKIQVLEPDYKSKAFKRTVMAKALDLKTYRAFYDRARAFYIEKSPDELSIQEWKKAPRASFTGPSLWRRAFGPEDIDELVWFLVNHEKIAVPRSQESAAQGAPRKRTRTRH